MEAVSNNNEEDELWVFNFLTKILGLVLLLFAFIVIIIIVIIIIITVNVIIIVVIITIIITIFIVWLQFIIYKDRPDDYMTSYLFYYT